MIQFRITFTVKRIFGSSFVRWYCSTKVKPRPDRFVAQKRLELSRKLYNMQDPKIESVLQPLRQSVKEQRDIVKHLQDNSVNDVNLEKALDELKSRRKKLTDAELMFASRTENQFERIKVQDLLKRRFFYEQSFTIYGGVSGLYDFGPMGCAMKNNLLQLWRKHFVLEESMLEVETATLTPETVLKASGHVDRFSDYMVKDIETGECHRADHLIKGHAEKMLNDENTPETLRDEINGVLTKLDGLSKDELETVLKRFEIKAPVTNNDLTEPTAFNLMFPTSISPTTKGYLRPETAQGIFVNFNRLLEFNHGRLPFAAAQIGTGFRNEISPRQGLNRVREFTMAEIEHFLDPNDKSYPKFHRVKNYEVRLFSACNQTNGEPAEVKTIGEAVESKLVANETLGYYLARVHQFLSKVGVDPDLLRFRQHLTNEMAHYACDCWDAEILTSYGWIECVGIADRSCYDLLQHSKATGVKLVAERQLKTPKIIDVLRCQPNKNVVEKIYNNKIGSILIEYLENLNETECEKFRQDLNSKGEIALNLNGNDFIVTKNMVIIKRVSKTVNVEEFIPGVIEPSFGIGRIMYAVFEHNFRERERDKRPYLALPPSIAPSKCCVLPLIRHADLLPFVYQLSDLLTDHDISHRIDDINRSIGRRYARTDEIGVPFSITIDFDTLKLPHTATLRDRDSMKQIRAEIKELPKIVNDLCRNKISWDDVLRLYLSVEQQNVEKINK